MRGAVFYGKNATLYGEKKQIMFLLLYTFQVKQICPHLLNVAFVKVQANSCPVVCRSACGRAGLTRFCDVTGCEGSWSGGIVHTFTLNVMLLQLDSKKICLVFFSPFEWNSNISHRNLLKLTFPQQNFSLSVSCLLISVTYIRGGFSKAHSHTINSSFFFISTVLFQPHVTHILCMWLLRMLICHSNSVWERKKC